MNHFSHNLNWQNDPKFPLQGRIQNSAKHLRWSFLQKTVRVLSTLYITQFVPNLSYCNFSGSKIRLNFFHSTMHSLKIWQSSRKSPEALQWEVNFWLHWNCRWGASLIHHVAKIWNIKTDGMGKPRLTSVSLVYQHFFSPININYWSNNLFSAF